MIQAVDALIARLIIVHLSRMNAQHIVAVHDCFRVNVNELHLLEAAIKQAYLDVFGSKFNNPTKDLPMGTDILAMFFDGLKEAQFDGADAIQTTTQFSKMRAGQVRNFQVCNGKPMAELINRLGETYYFAK